MTDDRRLFKCLAIRNAERVAGWPDLDSFIRNPDAESPVTPFQTDVHKLASAPEIAAAAQSFIERAGYRDGRPYPAEVLGLAELYTALGRAVRGDEPPARLRERLDKLVARRVPGVTRDNVIEHIRAIWDHLIAFFHVPEAARRDPGLFVDALRVVHVWQNAGRADDSAALARLFGATPVIPAWAIGSADSGEPEPPGGGDLPPDVHERLDELNGLIEERQNIDAVLQDLDRGYRRRRRRAAAKPSKRAAAAESAPVPIADAGAVAPWRSNGFYADELEAASVSLLDDLTPDWKTLSQDELADTLGARQAELATAAYALGGKTALEAADRLTLEDFVLIPGTIDPPKQAFDAPYEGSVGTVHAGGVGDLLVVTDTLRGYEPGEIAHVENVMQSESRERTHRVLDRTLESVTTETEEAAEVTRDLETTDRFSLQREVEKAVETDSSFEAGVSVSASYGPAVSADFSTDFAVSNATSTSESTATEYAQDVVDRASTKVSESTRTAIVTRKLLEMEERNSHGFDNTGGSGHIVGIYRWLNTRWEAQVWNYGRRALLEFIVPEPARLHRLALAAGEAGAVDAEPPPPLDDLTPEDITPQTYALYLGLYHPQGAKAPPDKFKYLSTTLEFPDKGPGVSGILSDVKKGSVQIPEGYKAIEAFVTSSLVGTPGAALASIVIGDRQGTPSPSVALELSGDIGQLDYAVYVFAVSLGIVAVEIRCERTAEAYEQWQIDTYEAIVAAHDAQLDAYQAKVASAEAGAAATADMLPPEVKREIERLELMRGALTILTGQHFADAGSVTGAESTTSGLPEIRLDETAEEGSYIQFFQQALEWSQLLYAFYPYFWGDKSEWLEVSGLGDGDPTFEAFLKAGAARVQVPVRPGYEKAVYNFLKAGVIWNGGSAPLVEDDLYLSIVEDLLEARGISWENPARYGPAWSYTLPTELVMLQDDATLPTWPAAPSP